MTTALIVVIFLMLAMSYFFVYGIARYRTMLLVSKRMENLGVDSMTIYLTIYPPKEQKREKDG